MKIFTVLAVLVLLAGCESQQHKQQEIEALKAQQATVDDTQCLSYGAQRGSDAYVRCRMQLDAQHAQAGEARRQRALQMLLNNQQPQKVYQVPTQINCTTTGSGQVTNTSCH